MRTLKHIFTLAIIFLLASCSSTKEADKKLYPIKVFTTLADSAGIPLEIKFNSGPSHNYPLMAIWIEDVDSNYIQTLYVAESIGKGTFDRAKAQSGKWEPGEARRPAALPYWGHKRGIQAPDGYYLPTSKEPVPDAITGATPTGDFILKTKLPEVDKKTIRILFEINQSWDWNEYWTNNKFPNNDEYKTSSQPALVYEVTINMDERNKEYVLEPIGHSHYSGKNGKLYTDISNLTTALEIAASIKVYFTE